MTEGEEIKMLKVWGPILDTIGSLIDRSIERTTGLEARSDDPRIISYFLLRRLRGHRDAFATLMNGRLHVDAEIILRAAIETAICLENLKVRGQAFYEDLKSDAARTVKGQIPIWFELDPELGNEAAGGLDLLFGQSRADGDKHTPLKWADLAADAAVPDLYRWYKHLSGTSAHVTGVSIFIDYPDEKAAELRRLRPVQALGMMCGAGVIGCRAHLSTMGFEELHAEAADIMTRMSLVG